MLCAAAVGACAGAPPAAATPASSHCTATERVQFSCRLGAKTVSLCAAGSGATGTLTYRYGPIGRVELAHTADGTAARRFGATSLPLQPGAQVQQVWFDRGAWRYLLAVCVGGNCPQEAVLAVLRNGRVAQRAVCPLAPGSQAWFADDVLHFGNGADLPRADARLVDLTEVDHPLVQLFIGSSQAPR